MRSPLLAAVALTLALGGCTTVENVLGRFGRTPGTEERTAYVAQAAAADLFEIESSRVALARSQRPAVREFAQMLLEEHLVSSQRLAGTALQAGMNAAPAALTAAQQAQLAVLQGAPAERFDQVFLTQQASAHETVMRIHHAYALAGDNRLLREVAASAVAKAHQHLDQLRKVDWVVPS
jgi:putative membrane protein